MGEYFSASVVANINQTLRGLRERLLPFDLIGYLTHDSSGEVASAHGLLSFLSANDDSRQLMALALARWDQAEPTESLRYTVAWTTERRRVIYELLGFDSIVYDEFDDRFSIHRHSGAEAVILAKDWAPWYDERDLQSNFYWNGYQSVLMANGWNPQSLEKIDLSSTQVVARLANPSSAEAYQSKGLVVGYVQSGKTAHFTAVIAKAIDAGYRLVVVLAGMHDILRSQTQRRLDMELVGVQNIVEGRDLNNPRQRREVDYASSDDEAWARGDFLVHTFDPSQEPDVPSIVRLSHYQKDFQALGAGIRAIDFKAPIQDRPVYDPSNLKQTDVRLVVVKKNKAKLQAFLEDLRAQRANLSEIPALIVDDEADQASINTVNQSNLSTDEKESRTAINKLITELLGEMPRAQYLAYTATPFANVFVNADDAADLFPKDFIFTLEAPPDYMGGQDFHDLEGIPDGEEPNITNSNRKAYVRDIRGKSQEELEEETLQAIDAFVLSGAIKLWRQQNCPSGVQFKHHTMLVHESVRTADHMLAQERILSLWKSFPHETFDGLERLRNLYLNDFRPMCEARSEGYSFPENFDELIDYIGEARGRIGEDGKPVRVVNGTKEADYNPLDFDTKDFWKILVGGSKLSRGFTVEGLTVSFYRRSSRQEDTLLQMGRWFGYRKGYKDLIRLYIDRNRDVGNKEFDLYEAFEAIVRDELEFRREIADYSALDENGSPIIQPVEVPPLVHNSADWLTPTARNKMYNSQLVEKGFGGSPSHLSISARLEDNPGVHEHNFSLVFPWYRDYEFIPAILQGTTAKFEAEIAILPADELVRVLEEFRWHDRARTANPKIRFISGLVRQGSFTDFVLVKKSEQPERTIHIDGIRIPLSTFKRRARGNDFELPLNRHRHPLSVMAGKAVDPAGETEISLRREKRGAVMVSFGTEYGLPADPQELTKADIAPIFTYVTPYERGQLPVAAYQYVSKERMREAVVDRSIIRGESG